VRKKAPARRKLPVVKAPVVPGVELAVEDEDLEAEEPAEVVAADAAAPPAEPEVIKKGKKEAEEGEAEAAPPAEKEKKK